MRTGFFDSQISQQHSGLTARPPNGLFGKRSESILKQVAGHLHGEAVAVLERHCQAAYLGELIGIKVAASVKLAFVEAPAFV